MLNYNIPDNMTMIRHHQVSIMNMCNEIFLCMYRELLGIYRGKLRVLRMNQAAVTASLKFNCSTSTTW